MCGRVCCVCVCVIVVCVCVCLLCVLCVCVCVCAQHKNMALGSTHVIKCFSWKGFYHGVERWQKFG